MAGPFGPAFLMVHHQGLAVCYVTLCLAYYLAFATAQALFPKNSPQDCFLNGKTLSGDEADRCRWQMKEGGGRENNEQTRGALARRSMRRLFFRVESLINKKTKESI